MKKQKGISLIVLVITIIVIIILAGSVILSLSNNNPIASATEATFKSTIDSYNSELAMALSNKYVTDLAFNPDTLSAPAWDGIDANKAGTVKQYITSMKATDGSKYIIQKGKLIYIGSDTNGMNWAQNSGVGDSKISDYVVSEGVNKPKLATGMTAKKWNTTTLVWDTVATPDTDTSWYDYTNKQWANAQTADGSMWVWIPRYVYNISSGWHTSVAGTINIQFSKGINDSWNGIIDSRSSASASDFTTNGGKFTNHPAFTFGSTELTGIWVAKFEASNSSEKVKVIPNVAAWTNINESSIFDACRVMEIDNIYGWGTTGIGLDTHLTKNVEWGAVVYLSDSIYGVNNQRIWINPDINYITGRAGTTVSAMPTAVTYAYNDLTYGINASTTGNIYGIYDMSGGSWDHTSGYVDNKLSNLSIYANNLLTADLKYKDVYQVGIADTKPDNYSSAIGIKGDAIYETSTAGTGNTSWFGIHSIMPDSTVQMFLRGTCFDYSTTSGIFAFSDAPADPSTRWGFRPVLVVSNTI
jgi:Tfp pilus assembly protein PilE